MKIQRCFGSRGAVNVVQVWVIYCLVSIFESIKFMYLGRGTLLYT